MGASSKTGSPRGRAAPSPALVDSTFLGALGPEDCAALVARLRLRRYRRGQIVFHQGDVGDSLHLVQAGHFEIQMVIETGQMMTLRVAHPGEMFGELALVQPEYRRSAQVCALEPAITLELHRRDFEAVRVAHPSVDRFLVAALAQRVLRTSELVSEMLLPPEARVWRRLAVLAEAYGDEPIRMTQEVLARAAGTVRQTANRVLRIGVEQGMLAVERGEIRVLDRVALDRLAHR